MKLPQIKNFKWNYLALAFAVPVVSMLAVMLCGSYEPFGNNRSMLYSDMYHQYYPFYLVFRDALRSGDSLLYSWNIGLGFDYLGLISYYLASPFNLLSVLIPDSLLLEYFSILSPIKLGLASLFFAIFLKRTFHKNDLSITLFGSLYGLCAWALGYQWNVMWLDTFALLPLVALGTVALLRDKKFFLYTVTLFLSIFINYYIGLFTCIFVLLLFFCYEICRFRGMGRFFSDLFRIALFSLLAIGMTAILELPALAALQTTHSSVNSFPAEFRLNIVDEHTWKGLLDAMRQVAGNMGGGVEPTLKEGLPNLYCGVGTIILAFLYLTTRHIRFRDKLCCVVLLLFFMVSFIIRQLDYIWHGFHFTNMIPYRFSFLFSFVLLYMAYRAYLLRRHFKIWQVVVAGILAIGVMACSNDRFDPVYLTYNLIFLILYLGVFLFPLLLKPLPKGTDKELYFARREAIYHRRNISAAVLAGVLAVEIVMNVINFGVSFPYTGISNYPRGKENAEAVIDYMHSQEKDTLFYRAETTHSQTLNDGALNGYNGISTFTSSANVKVTQFMADLGYGAKNSYNRYCYEESSPIADLFLGIKYRIERDGPVKKDPYYSNVYSSGNVHLLENTAYLPLGFLTEVQLSTLDIGGSVDTFTTHNKLLQASSGISRNAWMKLTKGEVTISSETVTLKSKNSASYCSYEADSEGGTIVYTITPLRSGLLCIDLTLPKKNSFTVSLNGEQLYSETYTIPQCLNVSYVEPGDIVEIELTCKADEKGSTTILSAILDEEVFRSAYEVLSSSTLELTSFSNTLVESNINCNRDGLLYTSIPQDGNWNVYVDGAKADTLLVGDAMISVPLTQGTHSVTFIYENRAFSLGWKISLACALIFFILVCVKYLWHRKKGKFER